MQPFFEWDQETKELLQQALLELFLKDKETVDQLKQSVWDSVRK